MTLRRFLAQAFDGSFAFIMLFLFMLVLGIIAAVALGDGGPRVAVLNASATCGGFYLTLRFDANVSGVFVEYSPLYYSTKLWVVGTCNGTRSDLAHFTRGQVAVCRFPIVLPNGTKYAVNVLTADSRGGVWVLARGVEVGVVCWS